MIPIGGTLEAETVEKTEETSRTYGINFFTGRAKGIVDGLEAVKQAVCKILQTERFTHLIYDSNYGSEISGLQGRNQGYVRSEIERRIREALFQDDRILAIENMKITISGDKSLATFTVVSTLGDFQSEVTTNV